MTLDQAFDSSVLIQLLKGVRIPEGQAKAKYVSRLSARRACVVLEQGLKRQVRQMFACLGLRVKKLVRVRIGSLWGGDLEPGHCQLMTPEQIADAGTNPRRRKGLLGAKQVFKPRTAPAVSKQEEEDEDDYDENEELDMQYLSVRRDLDGADISEYTRIYSIDSIYTEQEDYSKILLEPGYNSKNEAKELYDGLYVDLSELMDVLMDEHMTYDEDEYFEKDKNNIVKPNKDGDIIKLVAGEYLENVTINVPNLTIKGPNAGINGVNGTREAEAVVKGVWTLTSAAQGITIDGLSLY